MNGQRYSNQMDALSRTSLKKALALALSPWFRYLISLTGRYLSSKERVLPGSCSQVDNAITSIFL